MSDLLAAVRRILDFELTVGEWIAAALLLGLPYLGVGFVWFVAHYDQFVGLHRLNLAAAVVGSVLAWPVLLLSTACVP